MSYRGLVPADSLSATWDFHTKYLVLEATVKVPPSVTDIKFERQPWTGGLYYKLEGTYGPPDPNPPVQQTVSDKTFFPNLPVVVPSGKIVVATLNGAQLVPIIWYYDAKPTTAPKSDAPAPDLSTLPTETSQDPLDIAVINGKEFDIKAKIPQGSNPLDPGKVQLSFYDDTALKFVTAFNEGSTTLVYRFKALKLGLTHVQIFGQAAPGRIGTWLATYNVSVGLDQTQQNGASK